MLLDICEISDGDAVRIISATTKALGHVIQKLTIGRFTEWARRQKFREWRTQISKNRLTYIDFQGAIVHWDSKLLSHLLKNENVEKLAILISCGDKEQLVGISLVENNPGFRQELYFLK